MSLIEFFEAMEHLHFVFGIPSFPESLGATLEGEICEII